MADLQGDERNSILRSAEPVQAIPQEVRCGPGANDDGCVSAESGTAGTTTGRATSSGSGSSGSPGCVSGVSSSEFDPCQATGKCGCPFECAGQPAVCELPCQSDETRISSIRAAWQDACSTVACGGASGNGMYNSTCQLSQSAEVGTCNVVQLVDGGFTALCYAAGTADGGCNPVADSRSPIV